MLFWNTCLFANRPDTPDRFSAIADASEIYVSDVTRMMDGRNAALIFASAEAAHRKRFDSTQTLYSVHWQTRRDPSGHGHV